MAFVLPPPESPITNYHKHSSNMANVFQKSCSAISFKISNHSSFKILSKRIRIQTLNVVLGCKLYSNQSDDENSENTGKVIPLVVSSLRVDRVAASGLGIARR